MSSSSPSTPMRGSVQPFTNERIQSLSGRHAPHFISEGVPTSHHHEPSISRNSSFIIRNLVGGSRLRNRKRSLSNGYFNPDWVRRYPRTGSGSSHHQRAATPQPQSSPSSTTDPIQPNQPAPSLINFNQFLTQHNLNTTHPTTTQFNSALDATINVAIELLMQNSIAIRRSQLDNGRIPSTPDPVTSAQDFTAFVRLVKNNLRNSENASPPPKHHTSSEGKMLIACFLQKVRYPQNVLFFPTTNSRSKNRRHMCRLPHPPEGVLHSELQPLVPVRTVQHNVRRTS